MTAMVRVKAILNFGRLSNCACIREFDMAAQPDMFLPNGDACHPAAGSSAPINTHRPAVVVGPKLSVSPVCKMICLPQVRQDVVGFIAVNMINRLDGPSVGDHSPDHSVGLKSDAVDSARKIAKFGEAIECFHPRKSGIPSLGHRFGRMFAAPPAFTRLKSLCGAFAPKQLTRLRLIAEKLAAQFGRDIGSGSHSAGPLRLVRAARKLATTARPVFPSRITVCSQLIRRDPVAAGWVGTGRRG